VPHQLLGEGVVVDDRGTGSLLFGQGPSAVARPRAALAPRCTPEGFLEAAVAEVHAVQAAVELARDRLPRAEVARETALVESLAQPTG